MSTKIKALLYLLACVMSWALIPVVSKFGQKDLDNHQFLFWSSLVSFAVLLITTIITKRSSQFLRLTGSDWLKSILLGLLGTYVYYILLYFAYANAGGMEVLVLQYTWPIFTVLFSLLILKEHLTRRKLVAIISGFLAVIIVVTKGEIRGIVFENLTVDLLVIIAAISFALFSVLSKKIQTDPLVLITIYFMTAAAASLISMLIMSELVLPSRTSLIPILFNGILVNGFSYLFWIRALRLADASFIAPFVYFTPVISAIYILLFFNEPFSMIYLIGLGLVVLGGLVNR